ncbi:hypothetical protein AB9M93_15190 [Peribacillus frigoritolerans]|uniref:hypothetical protein n=1 Tax=Peribacillus frigoritolerans TaxID=450367 RepID=UPI0022819205|nr:hypothetical protein [Peribacillus frigoritolerans]MCY9138186.1 hypothetical protein [Peribacillus frigoritolerans]
MQNNSKLGIVLILISLAVSIYFLIDSKSLIPKGYELAIDGYVISRNLMIIFTLYLVAKLGDFLINKKG